MIGRRAQENIIVVLIILVLAGIIVMSFGYGPRARLVPVPVAAFGLVLAVVQLVWQNLRSADELQVDLLEVLTKRKNVSTQAEPQPAAAAQAPVADTGARWKREMKAYGMVLLFLAMVWAMGPMPSVFLFTLGYFAVSRQYSWLRAIAYTVIFTAAVYAVFVYALEIQLYHGYLEPVVEYFR